MYIKKKTHGYSKNMFLRSGKRNEFVNLCKEVAYNYLSSIIYHCFGSSYECYVNETGDCKYCMISRQL